MRERKGIGENNNLQPNSGVNPIQEHATEVQYWTDRGGMTIIIS